MNADRWTLPGRRELMNQHASFPAFRAIAARRPRRGTLVGFAYGFHGATGQWWYDSVRMALASSSGIGQDATQAWMADCVEIAEVHVHSKYQHQGIGTRMLTQLTGGRTEQTALLSTPDRESTARRLYRQLGFSDLLTGYRFPGGSPPYAIMGALLPLRDRRGSPASPGARQSASPSIW
jgi:GNAT superfamily N-acetyltransferase